jgi:hypothetical protein
MPDEATPTIQTMPLAELRRRVREVESLLRVAREHIRASFDRETPTDDGEDHAAATAARVTSILEEVEQLLPGFKRAPLTPEERDRLHIAELKAVLAHVEDGFARVELFERVGAEVGSLLTLLTDRLERARRNAELALTIQEVQRRRLS